MRFSSEKQGKVQYLVCELEHGEDMDRFAYEMLSNNRIFGLAPVLYTEMSGHRLLKYAVTDKVTVGQLCTGEVRMKSALTAWYRILSAVVSMEDYMVDRNSMRIEPEHLYVTQNGMQSALVYVPIAASGDVAEPLLRHMRDTLQAATFDTNEPYDDDDYEDYRACWSQTLAYIEETDTPDLRALCKLMRSCMRFPEPKGAKAVQPKERPVAALTKQVAVYPRATEKPPVSEQPKSPEMEVPERPAVPHAEQEADSFAIPGNFTYHANAASSAQEDSAEDEAEITFMKLLTSYSKENVARYKAQKEAKAQKEK